MPLSGTRLRSSATYTQPLGIGPTPAVYARTGSHTQQSSTGPSHAVQNCLSAIKPLAITTARTGHTPNSPLGPLAADTLSASAQFALSTTFLKPSA